MNAHQEFKHALFAHIRTDEETGGEQDVREQELRTLLTRTNTEQILRFMEAHDVAALLSVCVRVHVSGATGAQTLANEEALAVSTDHPAQKLLGDLRKTEEGRIYYTAIAELLLWATRETDLKPYLQPPMRHASVATETEDT